MTDELLIGAERTLTDKPPMPADLAPKTDSPATTDSSIVNPQSADAKATEHRNLAEHPIKIAKGWHLPVGVVITLVISGVTGLATLLWYVLLEPALDRMVQKHVETKTEQQVAKTLADKSAKIDRTAEFVQAYASIALIPKEQMDTEGPDIYRKMVKKYPEGFDVEFSDQFMLAGLQAIVNTQNPRAYEDEVQFTKRHYTKPSNAQFTHAMGCYHVREGNLCEANTDLVTSLRMFDSGRNPQVRGATLIQLGILALIGGDVET